MNGDRLLKAAVQLAFYFETWDISEKLVQLEACLQHDDIYIRFLLFHIFGLLSYLNFMFLVNYRKRYRSMAKFSSD